MANTRTLTRSKTNRVLGGVCGGLGAYFNVDPTILRVLAVALAIWGGSGVLLYLILWLVIPETGEENLSAEERARHAGAEMKATAQTMVGQGDGPNRLSGAAILGIVLIVVGFASLGKLLLPWDIFRWDLFWPLLIIVLGVLIIARRK